MSDRSEKIFFVTAIILVPILLGLTPIKMVQRIGDGCPFSQSKQILNCNPCPFHSIISQEDQGTANLSLTFFAVASVDLQDFEVLSSRFITSNSPHTIIPLRC
jgi:hypothetical protein